MSSPQYLYINVKHCAEEELLLKCSFVFTELAIQPSLNASLLPRYSQPNDATIASDKTAAAGSSSNAPPLSPSGMSSITSIYF